MDINNTQITTEQEKIDFMLNGGKLISRRGDEAYWNGEKFIIEFSSGGDSIFMMSYIHTFEIKGKK